MRLISLFILLLISCSGMSQEVAEIKRHKASYRTIYTHTIIKAPADLVWKTLLDFEKWSSWSSTFTNIEGPFVHDSTVMVSFKKKEGKINQTPHRLIIVAGEYFGWNDSNLFGSADNHKFIVEKLNENSTKFIQSDQMKGGGTWLMGGLVMKKLKKVFTAFNRELKVEVEKRHIMPFAPKKD
jgi:hypothetical protein